MAEENPRVQGDLCRAIHIGPASIEWICVKPPHNPGYKRKKGDRTHARGETVFGTGGHQPGPERGYSAPPADRHYFVNRWPNREDA